VDGWYITTYGGYHGHKKIVVQREWEVIRGGRVHDMSMGEGLIAIINSGRVYLEGVFLEVSGSR